MTTNDATLGSQLGMEDRPLPDFALDNQTCDECGHDAESHMNAHDQSPLVAAVIFDIPTCWAENVCADCDPELYAGLVRIVAVTASAAASPVR